MYATREEIVVTSKNAAVLLDMQDIFVNLFYAMDCITMTLQYALDMEFVQVQTPVSVVMAGPRKIVKNLFALEYLHRIHLLATEECVLEITLVYVMDLLDLNVKLLSVMERVLQIPLYVLDMVIAPQVILASVN